MSGYDGCVNERKCVTERKRFHFQCFSVFKDIQKNTFLTEKNDSDTQKTHEHTHRDLTSRTDTVHDLIFDSPRVSRGCTIEAGNVN